MHSLPKDSLSIDRDYRSDALALLVIEEVAQTTGNWTQGVRRASFHEQLDRPVLVEDGVPTQAHDDGVRLRGDLRSVLRLRLAAPETDDLVTAKLASAIADIAGPEEVDWLLGLGRETESRYVRVNAILALGRSEYRIGSRKSPPWFRTIIENRDAADATLIAVAVALRDVGDFSFVPPLSTRLRQDADLSPVVGEEFVQTIGLLLGRRLHGDTFGRPEDDS